ncbi:MAG: M20/M25/M40 family metallo-hydrolase [Kiritimatiellae bacterium]|nr:M20/M25/M40 family metallo-hydrolase [Kiritimatiellia bacterium]
MNDVIPRDVVRAVDTAVKFHSNDALTLLQQLIRIPSVNHPPTGDEAAVQRFYYKYLKKAGLAPILSDATRVRAFAGHPGRLKDHCMKGRPNVVAKIKGAGGAKSLMLIAHADVELPGNVNLWWRKNPFSGRLYKGRIYGRGAGDDKHGMMVNAMVPIILKTAGIRLKGDLILTSVSDEEQGGSNGAVALLAKGYRADATINADGCNLNLCVSNLGGGFGIVDLTANPADGNSFALAEYFTRISERLLVLRENRKKLFSASRLYRTPVFLKNIISPVDVQLATQEPLKGSFKLWFYLLPGESPREFKKLIMQALAPLQGKGGAFRVRWMPRFVLPSSVPENHPFVKVFGKAFSLAKGCLPRITGSFMSDMGFVNRYGGYPCISFGASRWGREGAVHGPNEFVDIRDLMICLKSVIYSVLMWCKYETAGVKTSKKGG